MSGGHTLNLYYVLLEIFGHVLSTLACSLDISLTHVCQTDAGKLNGQRKMKMVISKMQMRFDINMD